jgi:coatomer protein complex subunit gamma
MDTDDEVRDRATYYCSILEKQDKALANRYIVEGLQVSRCETRTVNERD